MPNIPQRISLISQTKDVLVRGIAERHWRKKLPSERRLCEELKVSRWTLRAALAVLAEEKLIRIVHGRPGEILTRVRSSARKAKFWRVGAIYPGPFTKLRPFVVQMYDEIRVRLQKMGGELDVYYGRKYYGTNCARPLAELVQQNPHTCWIVALSTRPMQRWFEEKRVPVIVGGSLHEGVRLPSINIDCRAIGRHAGGMMLSRGHRRIALLASTRGVAGIPAGGLEIAEGLRQAFAASRHADDNPIVVYHNGTPRRVCQIVEQLRRQSGPPTALLISDSSTLLTVMTYLASCGVQIPRDLSIVVAEEEQYFPHIVPELTHYVWTLEKFIVHWSRLLHHALEQTLRPDHGVRIVPRFVTGKTLLTVARR